MLCLSLHVMEDTLDRSENAYPGHPPLVHPSRSLKLEQTLGGLISVLTGLAYVQFMLNTGLDVSVTIVLKDFYEQLRHRC